MFCNEIIPVDTHIKFIILIHPKESKRQKTGTGRLTNVIIKDSEIIQGIDFTESNRVNDLLNDHSYYSVLLFPKPNSLFVEDKGFSDTLNDRKLLVFIIDGTWLNAQSIIRKSKNLQMIPSISFKKKYISKYVFKKQPKNYYLSTIESVYYLLKALKDQNLVNIHANYESLMVVFMKMVNIQLCFWKGDDKNKKNLAVGPDL